MVLSSSDPADHRKPCTLCHTPRDVLVRCQIDSTRKWHFVCPGACWRSVSGGVVDGNYKAASEQHSPEEVGEGHEGDSTTSGGKVEGGEGVGRKEYRYGGMWKNKVGGVSAKMPKKKKEMKMKDLAGNVEKSNEVRSGEGTF